MTKEWYFCTPNLALVCIEAVSGFARMFYNCFQVGIMVMVMVIIDPLLENVLGVDQTKGEMQESMSSSSSFLRGSRSATGTQHGG